MCIIHTLYSAEYIRLNRPFLDRQWYTLTIYTYMYSRFVTINLYSLSCFRKRIIGIATTTTTIFCMTINIVVKSFFPAFLVQQRVQYNKY